MDHLEDPILSSVCVCMKIVAYLQFVNNWENEVLIHGIWADLIFRQPIDQ